MRRWVERLVVFALGRLGLPTEFAEQIADWISTIIEELRSNPDDGVIFEKFAADTVPIQATHDGKYALLEKLIHLACDFAGLDESICAKICSVAEFLIDEFLMQQQEAKS